MRIMAVFTEWQTLLWALCITSFKPHGHHEEAVYIIPIFIRAMCKDSVSLKKVSSSL